MDISDTIKSAASKNNRPGVKIHRAVHRSFSLEKRRRRRQHQERQVVAAGPAGARILIITASIPQDST